MAGLVPFCLLFQGGKETWSVATVSVVCVAAAAVIVSIESRKERPELPALRFRWLIAVAVLSTLPCFFVSVEPYATRVEWMRNAIYVVYLLLVLRAFGERPGLLWIVVVAGVDATAVLGFALPDPRFPGRATGTLPNPTLFCEAMIMGAAVSLATLMEGVESERRTARWWFWVASILLCLVAAFASRSRVLLLAFPPAVLVAGYRFARVRFRLPGAVALSAATVAALVVAGSLWLAPSPLHERMTGLATADPFANLRPRIWSATLAMIRDHPWGVGWGAYASAFPPYAFAVAGAVARWGMTANFAHNEYLEILADGGWVALGGILAFLAVVGWFALRRVADPKVSNAAPSAVLVCMAASGIVDFSWHVPAFALVLAASMGFVLSAGPSPVPRLAWIRGRIGSRFDLYLGGIAACLALLLAAPATAQRLHWAATKAAEQGDRKRALRDLRWTIYLASSWKLPWISIGEVQHGMFLTAPDSEVLGSAKAAFGEAERLASADPDPWRRQAVLMLDASNRAKAAADAARNRGEAGAAAEEALHRDPHSPFVLQLLARLSELNGDVEQAREFLERAVELEPEFAAGHDDLARLLAKSDPMAAAIHRREAEGAASQLPRCTTDYERALVRRYPAARTP